MTLCIIQARLGSTRLPRKSLLPLAGKPLIRHVVDRARAIVGVDAVVLAVPHPDLPEWPVMTVDLIGPSVPDSDVLGRFARTLAYYPAVETVMRVTGDCPLLDPVVAAAVLREYHAGAAPYASNLHWPTYVDGEDVEVFSADILRRADREATDPADREHVTPWIRRLCHAPAPVTPLRKTSVDTLEDYERVRNILECSNAT